jgi:hypothetical protein
MHFIVDKQSAIRNRSFGKVEGDGEARFFTSPHKVEISRGRIMKTNGIVM